MSYNTDRYEQIPSYLCGIRKYIPVFQIGKDETSGQSFVSTVIVEVCSGYNKHKLPDLVKLCAELTTQHNYLEAIWISAINSPQQCGYVLRESGYRGQGVFNRGLVSVVGGKGVRKECRAIFTFHLISLS